MTGCWIEKLPESWKDYIKTWKHKKRQVSLEDAFISIRIEEKNKIRDASDKANKFHSNVNLIENIPQPTKRQNNSNKRNPNKPKNLITKKKGHCFVCEKIRHYAYQCMSRTQGKGDNRNPLKANMTEGEGNDIIAAVFVSEVNMVDGSKDWVELLDTY